jgi:alcohol dehydrogenase (cytochrome c)
MRSMPRLVSDSGEPTRYQRPVNQAVQPGKATHTSAEAARSGSPVCLILHRTSPTGVLENPAPWVADNRPGDNLYTDSTLALDIDTGRLKSYHQYTPHDSWDWDEVSAPLLIDTEIDGRPVKAATHAGRNGYLWILGRDQGELKFLRAFPFSNNNVFTSIDSKTGRPLIDESKRPGANQSGEFCPSIGGGKDWPPEAWSPRTKLLYVPANNNICAFLPKGEVPKSDAAGFYVGYQAESIFGSVRTSTGAADHLGELQAST